MNNLEILSQIVNWMVLAFIFTRVIGTGCFSRFEWLLTFISVMFAYFIKFVSTKIEN